MGALVLAEPVYDFGEFGIVTVSLEPLELARIMPIDFFFDRRGAGHRRFRAEQRSGRAERIPRDGPYRLQGGGTDATLRHHGIEFGLMSALLLGHGAYLRRIWRAVAHHGELPGIDAGGAVFAGLIDADHRGAIVHVRPLLATRTKTATAEAAEMMALKPASEIPAKVQGATSHRTRGASMIAASGSPPTSWIVLAQPVMPSHQPYSTPAWKAPIRPDTRIAKPASEIHNRLGGARVETSARPTAAKCG